MIKKMIFTLIMLCFFGISIVYSAEKPRWVGQPIYVYIEDFGEYSELMQRAFETWEEISEDLVRFSFVNKPSNANIDVYFVDYVENCNSDMAIGCTRMSTRGGQYYKAQVEIALNLKYSDGVLRPITNMYSVMLHEVGHAIGLGHSPSFDSIMYPYELPTQQYLTDEDFKLLYNKYH